MAPVFKLHFPPRPHVELAMVRICCSNNFLVLLMLQVMHFDSWTLDHLHLASHQCFGTYQHDCNHRRKQTNNKYEENDNGNHGRNSASSSNITTKTLNIMIATWNTGNRPLKGGVCRSSVGDYIKQTINKTHNDAIIPFQEVQPWNRLDQQIFATHTHTHYSHTHSPTTQYSSPRPSH